MSIADGRLFFFARSCREGTGFSGRLMPAGHLLFCATKKVSKKVAGNAIPRSRLPSERKIAHSRISSVYPYFDTNVRSREYLGKLTVIFDSGRAPGRPLRVYEGFGPPEGRRPARPLARKLILIVGLKSTPGFLHWCRSTGKDC